MDRAHQKLPSTALTSADLDTQGLLCIFGCLQQSYLLMVEHSIPALEVVVIFIISAHRLF